MDLDELKVNLREFFDETAADYNDYWARRGKYYDPASNAQFLAQAGELGREVTRFAASLPHSPDARALDLACGPGKWSVQVARTLSPEALTVALDWSPTMLHEAQELLTEAEMNKLVSLVRADAYSLPFANASFDGILMGFWLGHVAKADYPAFFKEIRRVLKPGGLILVLDSGPFPGRPNEELQNRQFKDGRTRQTVKVRFSAEELKAVLEEHCGTTRVSARLTTRHLFVMGWAQL